MSQRNRGSSVSIGEYRRGMWSSGSSTMAKHTWRRMSQVYQKIKCQEDSDGYSTSVICRRKLDRDRITAKTPTPVDVCALTAQGLEALKEALYQAVMEGT